MYNCVMLRVKVTGSDIHTRNMYAFGKQSVTRNSQGEKSDLTRKYAAQHALVILRVLVLHQ